MVVRDRFLSRTKSINTESNDEKAKESLFASFSYTFRLSCENAKTPLAALSSFKWADFCFTSVKGRSFNVMKFAFD